MILYYPTKFHFNTMNSFRDIAPLPPSSQPGRGTLEKPVSDRVNLTVQIYIPSPYSLTQIVLNIIAKEPPAASTVNFTLGTVTYFVSFILAYGNNSAVVCSHVLLTYHSKGSPAPPHSLSVGPGPTLSTQTLATLQTSYGFWTLAPRFTAF